MAFIDQGEFEATKTLSGCRAPCCDKHQFCAKMTVSTQTVFKKSLLNIVVLTRKKERIRKMEFSFSYLPHGFWPLMSLADHKGTQRGSVGA